MSNVPSCGRIVHYRLTRQDADEANRRREMSRGLIDHHGNRAAAGDIVPLLIVKVWPDCYVLDRSFCCDWPPAPRGEELMWSFPRSTFGVNGQAFLDGNDSLWVTSAPEGDANGCWEWPPRS